MYDLSILIPARNERFLSDTVSNILQNIQGNTEIIVVLDGEWADPPVQKHERVTVVYLSKSIGQRAATNLAAKLSTAKYVMKVDAHCAFDKGFDVKMMADMQDDWTMVPIMYNLHVFDWVCPQCGNKWYQGPVPLKCQIDIRQKPEREPCANTKGFEREMVFKARQMGPTKRGPMNTAYRFNKQLEFNYFGKYKKKQIGDIVDTMSLAGSCFMSTREKYWEIDLCDESLGSWGGQGAEVAIKTWLSGGRVVCNKKTWYAHLFRTRKGFSFPYSNPGNEQKKAKDCLRKTFLNDSWPKATRKLQWLVDKFAPVPDWHEPDKEKPPVHGAIYYTDNELDENIAKACRKQIKKGIKEKYIVSASLKPLAFGTNIHINLERGYLTMAKQILAALEKQTADIIFFCEHDVLYHPSHFQFTPPKRNIFYYNTNVWKVRTSDGHAMRTADMKQLSGLCCYRELALEHFRKRIEVFEKKYRILGTADFNSYVRKVGFEPGTHNRPERIDDYKADGWESEFPNLDIRHDKNLTLSRWRKGQFRNQKFTEGWQEKQVRQIDGWFENGWGLFD